MIVYSRSYPRIINSYSKHSLSINILDLSTMQNESNKWVRIKTVAVGFITNQYPITNSGQSRTCDTH